MLRNAAEGGVVSNFREKKRYVGVQFNVKYSVTRGWVGVNFPDKKD